MRYEDNQEIRQTLLAFIKEADERELRFVTCFAIGYYGALDLNIWSIIMSLYDEGYIK